MCECYTIGGPWIAEDPDCPAHGAGGLQEQLDERDMLIMHLEQQIIELKAEIETQRQAGYL